MERKRVRQILIDIIIDKWTLKIHTMLKLRKNQYLDRKNNKKDQLIGSLEYLIFKSNKIVLIHTAIEFAIIMTKSLIPIP